MLACYRDDGDGIEIFFYDTLKKAAINIDRARDWFRRASFCVHKRPALFMLLLLEAARERADRSWEWELVDAAARGFEKSYTTHLFVS